MSRFHSFHGSRFHAFVESPFHQRNAADPQCELQIHAVQTISGWVPFDYVVPPGTPYDCDTYEISKIYMTRTVLMEWGLSSTCVAAEFGPLSATEVTKKHRKFDDNGGVYYTSLEIGCADTYDGMAYIFELMDSGVQVNWWNPDIYIDDDNDGLAEALADQLCIVPEGGGPFTDYKTQSIVGYSASAGRCGEAGALRTEVVITGDYQRVTTTYDDDPLSPDYNEVTSRLTETLSDPWLKESDPNGPSWYGLTLELLKKVGLDEERRTFSILDSGPPRDEERFGCDEDAGDVNSIALYWRRGEPGLFGVKLELPGAVSLPTDWQQPDYLMIEDWHSGSVDDFLTTIQAKKSRLFEPICLVFQPVVCDGLGGFDTPAGLRECRRAGPISDFINVEPDGRNGVTYSDSTNCAAVCV